MLQQLVMHVAAQALRACCSGLACLGRCLWNSLALLCDVQGAAVLVVAQQQHPAALLVVTQQQHPAAQSPRQLTWRAAGPVGHAYWRGPGALAGFLAYPQLLVIDCLHAFLAPGS